MFHKTTILILALGIAAPAAMAQSFQSGSLLVTRTVYAGTAGTVTIGQALPGGGRAVADGSFPNVFKNETADPSFGVTSPIFLDQFTISGGLINSRGIDSSLITSSFASKSELAINVSTDRSSVSFVGYAAPVNALDVSNSNTAQVFDPTNPVASTYARAIAQVDLKTGALQVTNINAYSGNNGRAAVLANGNYYLVGNAGNGSGNGTTLSQLSDNTGVQKIAAGTSGNTTAVGAVQGTFGSSTGYQRGFSLAQLPDQANPSQNYAADKTGKDDNFRGMTVFNNTLYVTKGSGSNGVDSVYQVGAAGALANGGSLGNAAINILPASTRCPRRSPNRRPIRSRCRIRSASGSGTRARCSSPTKATVSGSGWPARIPASPACRNGSSATESGRCSRRSRPVSSGRPTRRAA